MAGEVVWYYKKWFVILLLILFFPLGLVLLWLSPATKLSGRIVWSMLFASLWATNSELDGGNLDEDPEEDDDAGDTVLSRHDILQSSEILNYILNVLDDMLEERLQAFEWVRNGMPALDFER